MGDSITEGTLVEWTKNIGDQCQVDDVVAVIETDKVSIDIRTDFAGVITEQLANLDDTLEVNAPLFKIDTSKTDGTPAAAAAATTTTESASSASSASSTSSTPSTPPPSPPTPSSLQPPPPPPPSATGLVDRTQNRVQMSRMRQRISQRLMEAQETTASLTTFNEIDMKNIITVRNKYKDIFADKHGIKLGFMSAFVKASCSALSDIPAVNAYIDGKDIVYNNYSDVSVAVASPNGLVVPVIRNANTLSFAQVEQEIMNYAQKAKTGTLSLEEMTGGTFTISNGGVFGSLFGTPIINPPQSAILGMHGTFERPVAINGQVEVRPIMYVALTYDHRIIDGREAVLFLKRIKECVEDPVRLLLDA
eukprot:CAMPEP_0201568728 /NCGR_PEP_ID=MMETSP0190_2-20130828/9948_1 /ASSEMBLY_ACC=CAM_ASM_000263 /TAXON_ID=37353 /ORGANISM="Rosalina sp." /LENGTH=362 /DNA_ID=CAMNT_0047990169 /DNA_START=187 /DNA_END=1275 /DNA_ORIENTATION=+